MRYLSALLDEQRVYGIQVPKERMNAACAASIEAIAGHYVDLLLAHQPKGGINLAGWSAGAIIALEMARQLRARGREVPLLTALDGAPCNTGGGLKAWHPLYTLKVLANLPAWVRADMNEDWSLDGFKRRIEFKLAYMFGLGADSAPRQPVLNQTETLDAGLVTAKLNANPWSSEQKAFVHAMYQAMERYVPEPYAGRVLVFETRTQPLYHLRQVGAAWRKIAPLTEIVMLEGNHSEIVRDRAIEIVARHLGARLAALRADEEARELPRAG
jgi:thioesterase domain-containing protein